MRDRSRRSESIEKAAVSGDGTGRDETPGAVGGGLCVRSPLTPPWLQEAAVLVAQRSQNPREFFRQRERAGSTSGSTSGPALPAGPMGSRPGT